MSGKIEQFEDLRCWQEARELTRCVYRLCTVDPIRSDYRLRNQLTGAALSVMSNIAEGFTRYHRREFARFLDIAQSSAAEVKSLLYVVQDQYGVPEDEIDDLQDRCDKTRALILGLLRYLRQSSETVREPLPAASGRTFLPRTTSSTHQYLTTSTLQHPHKP
jgi:four helix bundle protein